MKRVYIIAIAAVLVIAVVIGIAVAAFGGSSTEKQLQVITETSLQKILEIGELNTLKYQYDAVAKAYTEGKNPKVKYYIAYEGKVTVGFDFDQVQFEIDDENKVVTIVLPEVRVTNIDVKPDTMEFIFVKDKYEKTEILKEAHEVCKQDLQERADSEGTLLKLARENAEDAIKALYMPWIQKAAPEFHVVIR